MQPSDLIRAREALNLSRRDLALVLGVSSSTVAHWEQGHQEAPPYLRHALIGVAIERLPTVLLMR
jgi:DNA-binding transcriptional regulator YiaG